MTLPCYSLILCSYILLVGMQGTYPRSGSYPRPRKASPLDTNIFILHFHGNLSHVLFLQLHKAHMPDRLIASLPRVIQPLRNSLGSGDTEVDKRVLECFQVALFVWSRPGLLAVKLSSR